MPGSLRDLRRSSHRRRRYRSTHVINGCHPFLPDGNDQPVHMTKKSLPQFLSCYLGKTWVIEDPLRLRLLVAQTPPVKPQKQKALGLGSQDGGYPRWAGAYDQKIPYSNAPFQVLFPQYTSLESSVQGDLSILPETPPILSGEGHLQRLSLTSEKEYRHKKPQGNRSFGGHFAGVFGCNSAGKVYIRKRVVANRSVVSTSISEQRSRSEIFYGEERC